VKEALGGQPPAKIAVVTNSGFVYALARAYGKLSWQDNPNFEVFSDVQEAQAWILKNSLVSGDPKGALEPLMKKRG